jgi:hypothetical protein
MLFHFISDSLRIIQEVRCLSWWRTMLRAIPLKCAEKFAIGKQFLVWLVITNHSQP